jgi:hypothetical protein
MSSVTIVQGEDRVLTFTIKEVDDKNVTTYMNLTGATEIEVRASNASSTYESFKLTDSEVTVVDAEGGVFRVHMSDVKTALLKIQPEQNIEVIVDIGAPSAGERRIAQLFKAITVVKRLFP